MAHKTNALTTELKGLCSIENIVFVGEHPKNMHNNEMPLAENVLKLVRLRPSGLPALAMPTTRRWWKHNSYYVNAINIIAKFWLCHDVFGHSEITSQPLWLSW